MSDAGRVLQHWGLSTASKLVFQTVVSIRNIPDTATRTFKHDAETSEKRQMDLGKAKKGDGGTTTLVIVANQETG